MSYMNKTKNGNKLSRVRSTDWKSCLKESLNHTKSCGISSYLANINCLQHTHQEISCVTSLNWHTQEPLCFTMGTRVVFLIELCFVTFFHESVSFYTVAYLSGRGGGYEDGYLNFISLKKVWRIWTCRYPHLICSSSSLDRWKRGPNYILFSSFPLLITSGFATDRN